MAFKILPTIVLLSMIVSLIVVDADVDVNAGPGAKNGRDGIYVDSSVVPDAGIEEDAIKTGTGCCPEYWMRMGSRCYIYFGQKKNWHDARNICHWNDGELPSIHNWEDNNALYYMWRELVSDPDIGYGYWIGLHDTYNEGRFVWSDSSPYNYQNWSPGQPDDCWDNEDCGHIFNVHGTHTGDKQKWNDLSCNDILPFFCVKNIE